MPNKRPSLQVVAVWPVVHYVDCASTHRASVGVCVCVCVSAEDDPFEYLEEKDLLAHLSPLEDWHASLVCINLDRACACACASVRNRLAMPSHMQIIVIIGRHQME
jgi:hypothetical protein